MSINSSFNITPPVFHLTGDNVSLNDAYSDAEQITGGMFDALEQEFTDLFPKDPDVLNEFRALKASFINNLLTLKMRAKDALEFDREAIQMLDTFAEQMDHIEKAAIARKKTFLPSQANLEKAVNKNFILIAAKAGNCDLPTRTSAPHLGGRVFSIGKCLKKQLASEAKDATEKPPETVGEGMFKLLVGIRPLETQVASHSENSASSGKEPPKKIAPKTEKEAAPKTSKGMFACLAGITNKDNPSTPAPELIKKLVSSAIDQLTLDTEKAEASPKRSPRKGMFEMLASIENKDGPRKMPPPPPVHKKVGSGLPRLEKFLKAHLQEPKTSSVEPQEEKKQSTKEHLL